MQVIQAWMRKSTAYRPGRYGRAGHGGREAGRLRKEWQAGQCRADRHGRTLKGKYGGAGRPDNALQGRSGQGRPGRLGKAGEGCQAHWAGQSREAGRQAGYSRRAKQGNVGRSVLAGSPGKRWQSRAE